MVVCVYVYDMCVSVVVDALLRVPGLVDALQCILTLAFCRGRAVPASVVVCALLRVLGRGLPQPLVRSNSRITSTSTCTLSSGSALYMLAR